MSSSSQPPTSRPTLLRLGIAGILLGVLFLVGWVIDLGFLSVLVQVGTWIALVVAVFLSLWRVYQRVLWHVSGKLAVSYVLIGVLPLPLFALLASLVLYLLGGFFLGHLYREASHDLVAQLEAAAAHGVEAEELRRAEVSLARARYRDGRRVDGDPRAPERFPEWLAAGPISNRSADPEADDGAPATGEARDDGVAPDLDAGPRFILLPDESLTLAAAWADEAGDGEVVFVDGGLRETLWWFSGIWINPLPADEGTESVRLQIGGANLSFNTDPRTPDEEADLRELRDRLFEQRRTGEDLEAGAGPRSEAGDGSEAGAVAPETRAETSRPGLLDRASLTWVEISEPALVLATGESIGEPVPVVLQTTPRDLARRLFSPSAEVGQFFWVAFLGASLLLLTIYAIAELVAVVIVFGLSRAVSRLHAATSRVAAGDFTTRLPVRRRDQVGELQRSFNSMAESLQDLVAESAQKELLEKELEIARAVQRSLIPQDLPAGGAIELTTLFEPSAAIGGDYFDILRRSEDELAVVIADVSGHGLPTGLRMAMVKAALLVLFEEERDPQALLRRLDAVVRSGQEGRFFVTATLATLDLTTDTLVITNAGHPPTYLVRRGAVREILLPGAPLGGLGQQRGQEVVVLEPGDVVVWLSDGLIEATSATGEPFGYERLKRGLENAPPSPHAVRTRLLAAVEAHTEGRPVADDRTLVVMGYRTGERTAPEPDGEGPSESADEPAQA